MCLKFMGLGSNTEDDGFVDMMDESTLRPGDCVPVGRLKLSSR